MLNQAKDQNAEEIFKSYFYNLANAIRFDDFYMAADTMLEGSPFYLVQQRLVADDVARESYIEPIFCEILNEEMIDYNHYQITTAEEIRIRSNGSEEYIKKL